MTLIGKMQRRLAHEASNKTAERVNDEIEASGKDGLELAARVCSVAYKGVKERLPANRDYRTGYAMALAELAVVLRGMRRGEHPRADEMAEARRGVVESIEKEFDAETAALAKSGALGITDEWLEAHPDCRPTVPFVPLGPDSELARAMPCPRCNGTRRIFTMGMGGNGFPCPECAS